MPYTVAQLAELVGGQLHGDGSTVVEAVLPFEEAVPGSITFITKKKYWLKIGECPASAFIVPKEFGASKLPTITVDDPLKAILKIAEKFAPQAPKRRAGVHPHASIDPAAEIGEGCYIGPFAVVEAGAVIGDRCKLHPHAVVRTGCKLAADVEIHPHAVLYPFTEVGARSIVHSGAVIGCDGFGYQLKEGKHDKVPQLGVVQLGCDVEIGANSSIDRATFGATRIGDGTKIDNQVMVGHNCQIGKHNVFVSQVGIAGSCKTGDYVVLAGKVGIADHVNIGKGATLAAGSGIYTDIPAGEVYLGTPGRPEREAKRIHLAIEKLPEMRKQLAELREYVGLSGKGGDATGAADRREAG